MLSPPGGQELLVWQLASPGERRSVPVVGPSLVAAAGPRGDPQPDRGPQWWHRPDGDGRRALRGGGWDLKTEGQRAERRGTASGDREKSVEQGLTGTDRRNKEPWTRDRPSEEANIFPTRITRIFYSNLRLVTSSQLESVHHFNENAVFVPRYWRSAKLATSSNWRDG